jgi:hypothetical protein
MRQQNQYNHFLYILGFMAKVLFVAMFVFTVSCILVAGLGGLEPAWATYRFIWPIFWRLCFTLLCVLAIAITLEGLQ